MKHELVVKLHSQFEEFAHTGKGVEYWLARDLQILLGYSKWENFKSAIEKAKIACGQSGHRVEDHFPDLRKMVDIGSKTQREIEDFALTRYACYLIAQNGDPKKPEISFAQTYFAVQTRKQELIEKRLVEIDRVQARKKLTNSEKELSGIIFERIGDNSGFARIRSRGDRALFGGKTTLDMKDRLNVPANRPLADFLPTITIKAKDFANEVTNFNIKKDDLKTEGVITQEHVRNNEDVRRILTDRNIRPEELPAAEDAKKVERRLRSEEKKLIAAVAEPAKKSRNPKSKE